MQLCLIHKQSHHTCEHTEECKDISNNDIVDKYREICNIRRTKSLNLNVCRVG